MHCSELSIVMLSMQSKPQNRLAFTAIVSPQVDNYLCVALPFGGQCQRLVWRPMSALNAKHGKVLKLSAAGCML